MREIIITGNHDGVNVRIKSKVSEEQKKMKQ